MSTDEIFRARPAEVSIARSRSGREVVAYAAIFGTPYPVSDQYGEYDEQIHRSAFDRALAKKASRPLYVYNHGFDLHGKKMPELQVPLGKALEIKPDSKGLLTRAEVSRSPVGEQVLEAIKDGSIDSYSFRGPVVRSTPTGRHFRPDRDGRRTLVTRHECGLTDFGPTPLAVNEGAKIMAVRSIVPAAADALAHLPLDEDEIARFAAQFARIFDVASAEPVLMRALAAGVSWRDPSVLEDIERGLRVISCRLTEPRYGEIEREQILIRGRLEEIAEMDDPDDEDEVTRAVILEDRSYEVDDLAARAAVLDAELDDLLYGDQSDEDEDADAEADEAVDEDEYDDEDAYSYA